jgi:hypothetical protein
MVEAHERLYARCLIAQTGAHPPRPGIANPSSDAGL